MFKYAGIVGLLATLLLSTALIADDGHEDEDGHEPISLRLEYPEMDAAVGRVLFAEIGCIACHAVNGVGGEDAVPLDAHGMEPVMNPFEFSAKMWTMAPYMIAAQEEAFGEQILFTGEELGHIEREIAETDMVTFAFGIAFGVVIGLFAVKIGKLSIGLGSAGGLLTSGLAIGYLRSIHPTFGRLPDAARWILMEFGLLIFMAGVGLRAGGDIIETFVAAGPVLVVAGVCVTLIPILVGYFFGRKVLKIHPVLLLGGITGSMTSGASLSVVTKAADSSVPSLGYTGAYAFANVLLTIAGSIILFF